MMEDNEFKLPVTLKGEELELDAKLLLSGYLHRFEVMVNGIPVLFEPDEEQNYRALVTPKQLEEHSSQLSYELLQAIAQRLQQLRER